MRMKKGDIIATFAVVAGIGLGSATFLRGTDPQNDVFTVNKEDCSVNMIFPRPFTRYDFMTEKVTHGRVLFSRPSKHNFDQASPLEKADIKKKEALLPPSCIEGKKKSGRQDPSLK